MKRSPDRRTVLLAAGVAAASAAWPAATQASEIAGAVTFEGGVAIPKGQLEIYLDDPALGVGEQRRVATTIIVSDGHSKHIAFTLPALEAGAAPATLVIVARLEREDGWLLARGRTPFHVGAPVSVTLTPVMY